MELRKQKRMRWVAAALLMVFSLSFASLALPYVPTLKFVKVAGVSKNDKPAKPSGQLPFEAKEKEKEGDSEVLSEAFVTVACFIVTDSRTVETALLYSAPRSCGNVTNLPLYLAKRVLLI
jgi:hypothetical protein